MDTRDYWKRVEARFAEVFASIPAPIAPQSHADKCLCEAVECCADESFNIPEEAR